MISYRDVVSPGRAVTVWLWDTWGPGRRGRGVSGDRAAAQRAAEECLRRGHADDAQVEEAFAVLGAALAPAYQRTGQCWRARRDARDHIAWEQYPLTLYPERSSGGCVLGNDVSL